MEQQQQKKRPKQSPKHGKDRPTSLAKGIPADANAAEALQGLFAFGTDIVKYLIKEPLLLAALWFSSLGAAALAVRVCWDHPWLPLFGVGISCLVMRFVQVVEFQGALALLPRYVSGALQRPLYELLSEFFNMGAVVVCNVMRLGMLACMELREEQRRELLTGMDPAFRDCVFRQPSGLLLPWPVRRALLGRNIDDIRTPSGVEAASATDPVVLARRQSTMQSRRNSSRAGSAAASAASCASEADAGSEAADEEYSPAGPVGRADTLIELVRGVHEVAENSKASAEFASMERILAQKMVTGTTAFAARNLVSTTQAQVGEALEYGKAKASEFAEGVQEAAADPQTRATAVGGAVALGAGGATTGLVSGGAIGAAVGILPAFFTFGLSIPVCAAIGSGVGSAAGAVAGGATGFLGGGALGWGVYGRKKGERPAAVQDGSEGEGEGEGDVPETMMPQS